MPMGMGMGGGYMGGAGTIVEPGLFGSTVISQDGFGDRVTDRRDIFGNETQTVTDRFGDRETVSRDIFGDETIVKTDAFGDREVIQRDMFGDTNVQFQGPRFF